MADAGLPRSVEVVLGAAGLVAAAPILAVAGAAIRATSPGPALFRQRRIGKGGRPFLLYKLRSMRSDTSGPGVTADGDARITAVGRILRKTKLDELPELWNVVKGDLALVGPRPEVERYVDPSDPLWQGVLKTRPGLTHPVTLRLRNEEDLLADAPIDAASYYVEKLLPFKLRGYLDYEATRSWLSDVGVLFETVRVVLAPSRAPLPTRSEIEGSGGECTGVAPAHTDRVSA